MDIDSHRIESIMEARMELQATLVRFTISNGRIEAIKVPAAVFAIAEEEPENGKIPKTFNPLRSSRFGRDNVGKSNTSGKCDHRNQTSRGPAKLALLRPHSPLNSKKLPFRVEFGLMRESKVDGRDRNMSWSMPIHGAPIPQDRSLRGSFNAAFKPCDLTIESTSSHESKVS